MQLVIFLFSLQLQHVLARSDHMLSQVKDMFGDDPRRYTGIPTLTAAPTTLLSKERYSKTSLQPKCNCKHILWGLFNSWLVSVVLVP